MKYMKVGNVELGLIKTIIREKGEAINRPSLSDVNGSEIKVLELSRLQPENIFICRVRGMTYKVNMGKKKSVAIFDPQTICQGSGCSVKGSPSYAGDQR